MILTCNCTSYRGPIQKAAGNVRAAEFQSMEYGARKRVHNPLAHKPKTTQEYRCTVCGIVRTKS